jgi:hypothetical protein
MMMGGERMIAHFQFKPMYQNQQLPGWTFSFYFKQQKFTGIYHPNGDIEWTSSFSENMDELSLKKQIHELMLYHVYDK